MRTNEGAGRSSLQTKVILISTVPVFLGNYFCYVHNRVIVLLSEAKELKTCEQRFFTTFKMTRMLAVSFSATRLLSAQVPFGPLTINSPSFENSSTASGPPKQRRSRSTTLAGREFKMLRATLLMLYTQPRDCPPEQSEGTQNCEQRFFTTFKMTRVLAVSFSATNPLSAQLPFGPL